MPRLARSTAVAAVALAATRLAALDTAVLVEAEDASLGSALATATADDVTYIATTVNVTGDAPTSNDTVATFTIDFPEAGDYELFARIYVGPMGPNDDSFIPANDFGNAALGSSSQWSVANGLGNAGFVDPDELILSVGNAGIQTWKWIRVSSFADVGILTVPPGQLEQTYRIATREDGLRIDKLAFGPLRVSFTVNQIENGLPGVDHRPPDDGEIFQAAGPILAHHSSKFLGSVWSGTSAYNKDFEFYWNGMWHGNAGKWGSVEAVRDVMNWTVLDEGYAFAQANDVKFNFHVLLWGAQQPNWISALEPTEQLEEIEEWFAAVANRYPNIDYLQVVNEPINAPPDGGGQSDGQPDSGQGRADYIDALGGTGETGFDWILEAFRLARKHFPDTPLMLNEYNVEGNHDRSDTYLQIIQALQAEDLIDLVGFQGHAFSTKFPTAATMEAILDKIAATGLPIMITEMEIDGHDDYVQLAEYQRVFPIYWEHPSVIGINLSGHIGNWRYDQGAYLVNDNFSERLALQWLRDYVAGAGWPNFDGFLAQRQLDPELHAPAADRDGDALPTAAEYLLGLDPATPNATAFLQPDANGLVSVALPLALERSAGSVALQTSADLRNWTAIARYDIHLRRPEGFIVSRQNGRTLLRFQTETDVTDKRFYRIQFATSD